MFYDILFMWGMCWVLFAQDVERMIHEWSFEG